MKFKHLAVASLCLSLGGSLAAQDRLPTKQLAGPIDEIRTGVMAEVDPIDTAIHSKSAMIPVNLQPSKDGVHRWSGAVAVDGSDFKMVLFSGEESWDVSLVQPSTQRPVAAHELATGQQRTRLEMGNNAFDGDFYGFTGVTPGDWTVSIEADAPLGAKGYLLYSSDSSYRLLSYKTTREQWAGNAIGFVAYGYQSAGKGPQTAAHNDIVDDARLRITAPNGQQSIFPMFDDGLHNDGAANDGIFGGSFTPRQAGEYQAQVVAEGRTPQGHPFVRTAQHVVPVVTPQVSLALDFASASLIDGQRLQVNLPVDNLVGAPDRYRVFAEVWGATPAGDMRPVNWIGGMTYVDNGNLSLSLDLRWIDRSEARSDFELRNLRIEDPDTFIPVVRVRSLPLQTPTLPEPNLGMTKAVDEAMLVGPRPARAEGATEAGGRLLLVHGYCSGNVWGPVSGQFSNDSIFLDTNQNRSHDAFANLIGSFGSSYSSYGIVAHSQGGAAALHLYTYYWSGLDYASGGRLIQSVGTPYQGTSLAGNAAVLGQIFGVGCGTNTDLTYSGASSWLSGIPSWARNAVNYYTTSFKDNWWSYDYCNIITDLLLNDPDDGTTEKAKGQLSSGVNRGHKSGWCHTSGMADPAQTTDSSRNSTMNSNAAN